MNESHWFGQMRAEGLISARWVWSVITVGQSHQRLEALQHLVADVWPWSQQWFNWGVCHQTGLVVGHLRAGRVTSCAHCCFDVSRCTVPRQQFAVVDVSAVTTCIHTHPTTTPYSRSTHITGWSKNRRGTLLLKYKWTTCIAVKQKSKQNQKS